MATFKCKIPFYVIMDKNIQFKDGEYTTNDQDQIDFLRALIHSFANPTGGLNPNLIGSNAYDSLIWEVTE